MFSNLFIVVSIVMATNPLTDIQTPEKKKSLLKKRDSKKRLVFLNLDDFGMGIESPLDIQNDKKIIPRSNLMSQISPTVHAAGMTNDSNDIPIAAEKASNKPNETKTIFSNTLENQFGDIIDLGSFN
ncbi:hypothetical protein NGRA_0791 [Nosema granulosis]|uniref:Uncharacterized protein n=1 Tax=Nosema granulosis TaxID=83296 RepID=A0A9P6GZP9_9MICR|nr:hypothetical protein NGRA_0791 [Nosema granulosis]